MEGKWLSCAKQLFLFFLKWPYYDNWIHHQIPVWESSCIRSFHLLAPKRTNDKILKWSERVTQPSPSFHSPEEPVFVGMLLHPLRWHHKNFEDTSFPYILLHLQPIFLSELDKA